MQKSSFVYVTYIRTTPEKLWQALREPEFTRLYWFDTILESDWKPGSSWLAKNSEGTLIISGEVIENDPPKRLVLTWLHEKSPEVKAEGPGRLTYTIEPSGEMVKLTILHEADKPDSKLLKSVSGGWPIVLASLKSLLETGKPLEGTSCKSCCG